MSGVTSQVDATTAAGEGAVRPGPAILLDEVSKVYGVPGAAVPALDRVSLEVAAGEFLCVVGASGCGKSTLLTMIAGLDRPTSGTLERPAGEAALMFQESALFPWLTVGRNVELALRLRGMSNRAERKRQVEDLLAMVQLGGFEHKRPHELSGGMRQRVALARALAQQRRVLLMDEPFGALDAQTRVLLQEEIARISSEAGKTVIFVTHGIDEALFLADRVVVMSPRPGRVREEVLVPLPRPRTAEMRSDPWFVSTVNDLWETLKPEWQKGE